MIAGEVAEVLFTRSPPRRSLTGYPAAGRARDLNPAARTLRTPVRHLALPRLLHHHVLNDLERSRDKTTRPRHHRTSARDLKNPPVTPTLRQDQRQRRLAPSSPSTSPSRSDIAARAGKHHATIAHLITSARIASSAGGSRCIAWPGSTGRAVHHSCGSPLSTPPDHRVTAPDNDGNADSEVRRKKNREKE